MNDSASELASSELYASLQPLIVRRWLAEHPGQRERTVTGTVISADISGFTRLAESLAHLGVRHAAERLTAIINQCFDPMIEEIDRRGGDVLKFGGDALFVLFDGAEHAQQACASAAAMMNILECTDVDGGTQLSMTIGAASGEIPLLLAGARRRELVVHGWVVDACLQCESDAEPGEILVHATTAAELPAAWVEDVEDGVLALRPLDDGVVAAPTLTVDTPVSNPVDWNVALGADIASAIHAFAGTVGENRLVNVAFVSLPTTDLDAVTIDAVVEKSIELCDRYGPTLLSTDVSRGGIKLFFASGAPIAGEDDEGAILAVLSKLVHDPASPPMRAGVNRGAVYAGFLGSDLCRTLTVMGDATNLAARLLGHAPDRSIAVSDAVLSRARGSYSTTELPPVLVRGRIEPVKVHVLGELQAPRRDRLAILPPLVGRRAELKVIRAGSIGDLVGHGSVVDLVGESGLGSSRLIHEFLGGLPATVLRFELDGGISIAAEPFRAVRPLLRAVAGLTDDERPADDATKLASWVGRVAPEHVGQLTSIGPAFGVQVAGPADELTLPEFRQERTIAILCDLLAATLNAPAVIVAEDLQWFDSGSRAMIDALARRVDERSWRVVTSSRPDQTTPGGDDAVLAVEPLGYDDVETLVSSIGDLPESARRDIALQSGGNPMFAIELALALESGDVLSDSIEGQVTARIDRLGHAHRVMLRTASVLGDQFPIDDLSALLGEQAPDWLFLGGLLHLDDRTVTFRSQIIREVAYAGLPGRRRKELHATAAEILTESGADATQLAWHFGQAENHESCWVHARIAAARSIELGLLADAFDQLMVAANAADLGDAVATQAELADVLTQAFHMGLGAKRHAEALAAGRRALTLLVDQRERIDLLVAIARTSAEAEGNFAEQIAVLQAELATCDSDVEGVRSSAALLGALAALQLRFATAQEALALAEESAALATRAGDQSLVARALLIVHVCCADLGDERMSEVGEELLRVASEVDDLTLLVSARSNVGLGYQGIGDWDGALEQFALAHALAEQLGDQHRKVFPVVNRAALLGERGQWDAARPILEELHRDARFDRSGFINAWVSSELGRLEASAGRSEAARAWLSGALIWFEQAQADREMYQTRVSLMAADLAEGRSDKVLLAADAIEEPVEIESRQTGRFDIIVGYAHMQQGRPDDAVPFFDRAATATEGVYVFGHALALHALSEAHEFVGAGRTAKRHLAVADEIFARLGVEALPLIPLPR